jgi:hypothetical protein
MLPITIELTPGDKKSSSEKKKKQGLLPKRNSP